ncbi:hypothetical protein PJP08_29465, partial [Mycobacterium kansasii]
EHITQSYAKCINWGSFVILRRLGYKYQFPTDFLRYVGFGGAEQRGGAIIQESFIFFLSF